MLYRNKVAVLVAAFFYCMLPSFSAARGYRAEFSRLNPNEIVCLIDTSGNTDLSGRPNPVFQMFKAKQKKNKKITAAILAFPFPFGIVGLHRIYLGTAPHVPVVYIGTLGGVLGVLPFIDFCVLVLDKDIDRFIENKKVLMWVDENKKPAK